MKLRVLLTLIITGLLSPSLYAAETKPAAPQPAAATAAVSAPAANAPQAATVTAPAPAAPGAASALTSDKDKFSYAVGWDIGEKLKKTGLEINSATLSQGLKDAIAGSPELLTQAQRQEVVQKVQKEFMAKKEAEFKQMAEKNKQEGDAYLAANKAKPGVKTTASGLQYRVIKEGTGATPTDTDEVVVEYRGKLINGQEFDSSYKRGKPAVAKVSDVIAGWKEALKMMKVGSEWEVVIPANLAYGESGLMGSPIGPNQTLIFTIKLDGINNANAAKAAPATETTKK